MKKKREQEGLKLINVAGTGSKPETETHKAAERCEENIKYVLRCLRKGSRLWINTWGAWSVVRKKPSALPCPRANRQLCIFKKALDKPLDSLHLQELLRSHLAPDALLPLRPPRLPHVNSRGSTWTRARFGCGHSVGETKGALQHGHGLFWVSHCQCQRGASATSSRAAGVPAAFRPNS